MGSKELIKKLLNRGPVPYESIKFDIIKWHLNEIYNLKPCKILDIGAGYNTEKFYLSDINLDKYTTVDLSSKLEVDIVGSVTDVQKFEKQINYQPDFVFVCDVLEHLPQKEIDIQKALKSLRKYCIDNKSKLVITLPQMYRLDALKLRHLEYKEHTVRFNQDEWREFIEKEFNVKLFSGIGFISTLPFLVMFFKNYSKKSILYRIQRKFRYKILGLSVIQKLDYYLTLSLGRLPIINRFCNGILFICEPKK